jgi:hypothetical protein
MALTIDPKITFTGKEASEGILEPAFIRPEMTRMMDIRQGLKAKEKIGFLGRLSKVTKKDAGCGTGKQSKTLPMSEKEWNPETLKVWLTFCEKDLEDTFFVYLTKNGIDRYDATAVSEFWNKWVLEVVTDAVQEDALRIGWFADKAIATVEDGGTLSNSASVTDYNQIDGFFKQIFDGVGAGTIRRVTIDKNAESTFADQLELGTDDYAYDIYRQMVNKADPRLRQAKDKILLVTETLFQNRIDEKEQKTQGVFEMIKRQDEDHNNSDDVFRKIPIISMDAIWDKWIQSDFSNGTKYDLPHRAILTTVSNLVAGFDAVGSVKDFKVWLNDDTEEVNMKGGYKYDVKLLQEFMMVAAY